MQSDRFNISKGQIIISLFIIIVIIIFLVFNFFEPQGQFLGVDYWHGSGRQKIVALTFDDGPNPPYTDEVLDILKKYHIKATFFLVGKKVEQHPDTARWIVAQGNAIGNHTFSHLDLLLHNEKDINREIERDENIIYQATGVRPRLFRPPHGFRDPLVYNVTRKRGYKIVLWSVMPWDWTRPGTKVIEKRVLSKTTNGSIILLHDGDADHINRTGDRHQTVEALPIIIETLQKRGYRFVTIPEMFHIQP